ncbi:MAG: phosphotransferase family protein [Actinomycetota bacterium]
MGQGSSSSNHSFPDHLGVRSDPETIETEWMRAVLEATGVAGDARLERSEFGGYVGTGQTGCNARFHLTWSDPTGRPPTIMGKFPSRDETARLTGFGGSAYITEWNFYRNLAHTVDVRAPKCLHAAFDAAEPGFCLIMEDLAGSEQGDHFAGLTIVEAALAIDLDVKLDAPRWGDQTLTDSWPQPSTEDERAERLHMLYAMLLPPFLERLGTRLDASIVDFVQKFASGVGRWARGTGSPLTVAHYDFRPDNFLFARSPGAPPLVVVDWQTVNQGMGMVDVAYLVASSFHPDRRADAERALVESYREQLTSRGITYDFDTCWRDYRFGALWGLIITVLATSMAARTERGDDLFVYMATQYGRQCIDLESLDLLG